MATTTSNLNSVIAKINAMKDQIDLTKPGIRGQGTAADDAQQIVCDGIEDRIYKQCDPTGKAWADNAEPYKTK